MRKIRALIRENTSVLWPVLLLGTLVSIPLYKQGIMCNDELIARFWGMQGPAAFYSHFFRIYLEVGRALAAPVASLTMYLGFVGDGYWGFRLIQIGTILLDAGLFAVFLYKLFHSKGFSLICGMSVVAFLPITFEHTAPNAFNALLNIPFSFLLISLILFTDYLKVGKKKILALSMFLLFMNLTCYESFLMFIPLYWCVIIGKYGIRNISQLVRKGVWPAATAAVYLVLYVLFRYLVPTEYPGIQIGGFSLKNALAVVWQLVKASFPGYYLFRSEYRQQAQAYNHLQIEHYIRILLVCLLFGAIVFMLLRRASEEKERRGTFFGCLGAGMLCVVLPTFPLAAAKMYQESVGSWWMSVPTTFFCYFGATFVCWFCIWRLAVRIKGRGFIVLVSMSAAAYLLPVQAMNDIFAQRQKEVFQRLTTMESLFSTKLADSLSGGNFFSTDFFKNINVLAVHNSYWDDFARMKGLDIRISNQWASAEDARIYYDDEQFVIWAGDAVCILTEEPAEGYGACRYVGDEFKLVKYQDPVPDNGFCEYYYTLSESGELVPDSREEFLRRLAEKQNAVGSELENCSKIKGYYEDGWVERSSEFLIRTGEAGKLELEVYCPQTGDDVRMVSVYVDGELYDEVEIAEEMQNIFIEARPNHVVRLGLEADFGQESGGEDERELSMIIVDMRGN